MSTGNDSILDAYLYETNTLLEQLDSIVLASEERTPSLRRISILSSVLCTPLKAPLQ